MGLWCRRSSPRLAPDCFLGGSGCQALIAPIKSVIKSKKGRPEQLAAEFLTEQAEVVYRDNFDQPDQFSDAALADQLVTAWGGRIGKLDFGRLVEAFGRLRVNERRNGTLNFHPKGTPMLRLAGAVALAPAQLVGIAQPGRTRER